MGYYKDNYGKSNFLSGLPSTCPSCQKKVFHYRLVSKTQVQSKQYVQGQSKYSIKKGLAGAILFGGVGAVMGINGKKGDSYYVGENIYNYTVICPECSFSFAVSDNK